ncbi:MAG: MarC family protein [Waddliaceae bacterium]
MTLFTISLVLFLIMDPIGNVSPYLSLVKELTPKRQRYILAREMLIALVTMLIFLFLGEVIFDLLHLSETTVRLSSGVILFIIALQILFPHLSSIREQLPKGEPFIIPLAIPLIAGPSLLATIMLYAHMEQTQSMMLLAIACAWIAAALILFSSVFLDRILGKKGLMACEKLMGMVLILLAMQRFLDGIEQFMIAFVGF